MLYIVLYCCILYVLGFMYFIWCSVCAVPNVLHCLYCIVCIVLCLVLSILIRYIGCVVLDVLYWMCCTRCVVLEVLCWMCCAGCVVLDVLCWMCCAGCVVLDVLFHKLAAARCIDHYCILLVGQSFQIVSIHKKLKIPNCSDSTHFAPRFSSVCRLRCLIKQN